MASGAEEAAKAARAKKPKRPPSPRGQVIGGIFSAVFSKETGMTKYSKLIGGAVGYIVGFFISWGVARGLGTCTNPADTTTCTIVGMSSADISNIILGILTLVGVYIAPPNSPLGKK